MNTVALARTIVAALQPLQGPAATGKLLVRSTGPSGVVRAGSFAVPVRDGGIEDNGIVFAAKNPAAQDGSWPVTSSGTLVDVEALHGGPIGNSAAGDPYRWAPPLDGIELVSAASGVLSGGAFLTTPNALRQIRQYKQLAAADVETFFRAQLSEYPAVALSWERMQPLGGAMGSSPGPRTARTGADTVLYRHTWLLWVVTSRADLEMQRREEGDTLRDVIVTRLHQRQAARGLRMSAAPGAEVLEASVFKVTPTSYVDLIRFGTTVALTFQHEAEFNDWLKTRIREQSVEQAGEKIDLPDQTVSMVR